MYDVYVPQVEGMSSEVLLPHPVNEQRRGPAICQIVRRSIPPQAEAGTNYYHPQAEVVHPMPEEVPQLKHWAPIKKNVVTTTAGVMRATRHNVSEDS